MPLDVNGDGWLDLYITNAQGYEVPGDYGAPSADPLRPTLLIQTGLVQGVPVFEDRTDALIPAGIKIHGKSIAVVDVDGDGLEDLVLAAAFGDQQRLLRRDPNGPGYLDESHRLGTLVLNAFHVAWGDLDDDGDFDLVFADAGPNSFKAPGGRPRLLLNDGLGFFQEFPGRLQAIQKIGPQNAKLVDLDGDLDLDIVVDGKSPSTHVYLNDGDARFTLDTSLVPDAAGAPNAGAYEAEWADMDGDLDLDCMYMNYLPVSGFPLADIAMQNQLAETGTPNMLPFPGALVGANAQDENEFAMLDADNDGDLDVLVATLSLGAPPSPEKLFINSGTFSPGFLTEAVGAFTPKINSTLDMAVADFDRDGRYDVVIVNGEIPGTSFENLYYENVGPKDTTEPTVGRVTELPPFLSRGELLRGHGVKAWVQDSVIDDGRTNLDVRLGWTVTQLGQATQGESPMGHVGGALFGGSFLPVAPAAGLVGARVETSVAAVDPSGNTGRSASQFFRVCGVEPEGPASLLELSTTQNPTPSDGFQFALEGGAPFQEGVLILGPRPTSVTLVGGVLRVDPKGARRVPFVLDAQGTANLSVFGPALAGDMAFAQAVVRSQVPSQSLGLSNGLRMAVCP